MAEIGKHTTAPGTRGDLVGQFRAGRKGGRPVGPTGKPLSRAERRSMSRRESFTPREGGRLLEAGSVTA